MGKENWKRDGRKEKEKREEVREWKYKGEELKKGTHSKSPFPVLRRGK